MSTVYQHLSWCITAGGMLLQVGRPKEPTFVTDMYTSTVHARSLLTSVTKVGMSSSTLRVSDLKCWCQHKTGLKRGAALTTPVSPALCIVSILLYSVILCQPFIISYVALSVAYHLPWRFVNCLYYLPWRFVSCLYYLPWSFVSCIYYLPWRFVTCLYYLPWCFVSCLSSSMMLCQLFISSPVILFWNASYCRVIFLLPYY